jgi:hypothetical protein
VGQRCRGHRLTRGDGRHAGPSLVCPGRRRRLDSTSAAEAAVDSTTGVCGALVPNASCPEAFLPLFDDVGGTLLTERRPKQTASTQKNEVML